MEVVLFQPVRPSGEAGTHQPHGHPVAGQHRNPAGVVADEGGQAAPDLHRGVPVVGQGQDAPGVLTPDPDQVGDAVHQHPGLPRPRPRQDQHVGLLPVIGHDAPLHGVVQALHDAAPGLGRGLTGQFPVPVRQPALQELVFRLAEVVHGQVQVVRRGPQAMLGVLRHHMDLPHLLVVVELQGGVIRLGEPAPLRLEQDGHGRTEHRQPLVQADHLLLVEPEQGPVHQPVGMPDLAVQHQVRLHRRQQLAHGGLGQQVGAPHALGHGGEQVLQQQSCRSSPHFGRLGQWSPVPLQRHLHRLPVPAAQSQAAPTTSLTPAVGGDASHDSPHQLRQRVGVALILEFLGRVAQVEREHLTPGLVRSPLAHEVDQTLLQRLRLTEAPARRTLHPGVDEGGDRRVVAGDPQPLQVMQRFPHPLGRQTRCRHQLVG